MKKVIIIVLTCCLLCTAVPIRSLAFEETDEYALHPFRIMAYWMKIVTVCVDEIIWSPLHWTFVKIDDAIEDDTWLVGPLTDTDSLDGGSEDVQ